MVNLLLGLVVNPALPPNAVFSCTGVPEITATRGQIDLPTHAVFLNLVRGHLEGSSRTEIHNGGSKPARVTISIPMQGLARVGNAPTVTVEAMLGTKPLFERTTRGPLELGEESAPWSRPVSTTVTLPPRSTNVLRVQFFSRLGFAGLDGNLKVAAYHFGGTTPIRQLNASFRYETDAIFGLPKMEPKEGWAVGQQGAFLRVNDYQPRNETTAATFYLSAFQR